MKSKRFVLAVSALCLTWVPPLFAGDDEFFYALGGGLPIGIGATDRTNTITVGGDVSWNADLTCGNFDISASIANQLNGVTGAFQNVMTNIVQTATGVIA